MEIRGRQLHFGVHMQGQRTSWAEYLRAVRAVEALGYGSIWTFDHLLPFSGDIDGPCFETLTTLGALAVATSTVRIGALVNGVVYRHPAILAKAAAQVDQMSQGRLEFSLGVGWAAKEFRTYGFEFAFVDRTLCTSGGSDAAREASLARTSVHVPRRLLPPRRCSLRAQARPVAAPSHHGWGHWAWDAAGCR